MESDYVSLGALIRSKIGVERFVSRIDVENERQKLGGAQLKQFLLDSDKYVKQLISVFEPIRQERKQSDSLQLEWIMSGHDEINTAYMNLEALDVLTEHALNHLEANPENIESLLDKISAICESSVRAKRSVHPVKRVSDVATQYREIKVTIMESIENELLKCLEEVGRLQGRPELEQIETQRVTFEEAKLYGDMRLPQCSEETRTVIDQFLALRRKAEPLNVSITYIPHALELFGSIAKNTYPGCVLKLIRLYSSLMKRYSELDDEIQRIQEQAITSRWRHVFDCLSEELQGQLDSMDGEDKAQLNYATSVLEYLARILSEKLIEEDRYTKRYDSMVSRFTRIINERKRAAMTVGPAYGQKRRVVSASVSSVAGARSGQSFIESLDMRPVMVEGVPVSIKIPQKSKDIVESMAQSERVELKATSKNIIGRLMEELEIPKEDDKENMVPATRKQLPTETPARQQQQQQHPNRQLSPNPFVTPSIHVRKSRLPKRTPDAKAKAFKYVPLPVASLDMELSQLTIEPTDITSQFTPQRENEKESRIPLPNRPASRISIQRSSSRQGVRSCSTSSALNRPPSRLEALGCEISSRNGTRRPSSAGTNTPQSEPRRAPSRLEAMGTRLSSRHGTSSPSDFSIERPGSSMSHQGQRPRPRSAMSRMGKRTSPLLPLMDPRGPRGLQLRAKSSMRLS